MDTISVMAKLKHDVTIENTGENFTCDEDQVVLKAMLALGRRGIPSGCHGGGCGVCKIKIVSGRYHTDTMSRDHVSAEEEKNGITLACRTYPKTDLKVSVIGKLKKAVTKKRYGLI